MSGLTPASRWALFCGNFFIGCGVMVVNGALNDIVQDLHMSVAQGGQMIAWSAVMMGVGAPVLATLLSRMERRLLLTLAMLWYAIGHALCALAPDASSLLGLRMATVLSAALFTPQAAATVNHLATPAQRASSVTFVFGGWALATVLGVPLSAWVGERLGWRVAMGGVSLGALLSALWVWRALPRQISLPPLTLQSWRQIAASPAMLGVVLVSCLQSAAQVSVLAYMAPYLRQVHQASAEWIGLTLAWFGVMALVGNALLNRVIDQLGPARCVAIALGMMGVSMLLWPLGVQLWLLWLVCLPWALSAFAVNSAQQARLGQMSPALATALLALNTSAIYSGHALGAGGGSWALGHSAGFAALHWLALGWLALAVLTSIWAARQRPR
jgi:MFS transporter, DHA1 family, inner membrane transport protein